ncbi:DUF3558 domain-containing protein [Nocardia beijingensis]
MRTITSAALTAGLLIAGLASAGCDSAGGTPTASSSSAAPAALFDPCSGISDDVLRGAGVDPASKESGIAGVEQSGWKICKWRGPAYAISVYSTGKPVSEFETKPGNIAFRDVTIAGRQGREFRSEGWQTQCNAVFPAAQGSLQLQILGRLSIDHPEDPCTVLARVGEKIVPVLPK